MRYGVFDEQGRATAFYWSPINGDDIPEEAMGLTEEQWLDLVQNQSTRRFVDGVVIEVVPPPSIDDYRGAVQKHLDETAKQRSYDSIHTAVGYRDDPNPAYAAEAQALFTWRSAVWGYAYSELTAVEGGTRPQPSVAELVAELPAIVWPA